MRKGQRIVFQAPVSGQLVLFCGQTRVLPCLRGRPADSRAIRLRRIYPVDVAYGLVCSLSVWLLRQRVPARAFRLFCAPGLFGAACNGGGGTSEVRADGVTLSEITPSTWTAPCACWEAPPGSAAGRQTVWALFHGSRLMPDAVLPHDTSMAARKLY